MLLAIDIGNTNVVWGIFEGQTLLAHWRLATDPKTTADEYGILCANLLVRSGRTAEQITGDIISSVVPALTGTFESMVQASEFVRVIESRQGYKIGCIEEIAWRAGWIDDVQLLALSRPLVKSGYGEYLERLLAEQR